MSDNTRKKTSFKDLKKQIKPNEYYNHPNNFGDEGDDHLNISIQSKTHLGMLFDPAYLRTIHYPYIGKFSSVMSLWHWVRSSDLDDNFRGLTGRRLKMYAEANGTFGKYVTNFKAIIAYATWLKIKSYPNVINEIKKFPDDFKFLSYHILSSSELRLCTNYAGLMIDIMTVITNAVKKGEEPNFDSFCDKGTDTSLKYLSGVLGKVLPHAKLKAMKESELAGTVPVEEDEPSEPDLMSEELEGKVSTEENEGTGEDNVKVIAKFVIEGPIVLKEEEKTEA